MNDKLHLKNPFPSVAGVVVLFNPNKDIISNIESYVNQVSELFIVDNSEMESAIVKEYVASNKRINYFFNGENLGVAAALNIAARKAIEKKYSYLLTMDQDSTAPDQLVEVMLRTAIEYDKAGIVSPLHSNIFKTHQKHINEGISKVDAVMTSGNLLSLDAYNSAGVFNEDFFIDYVDVEYCLRLKSKGFNIYKVNSIVLEHKEANISESKILNRKVYPTNNDPKRIYYKTRNLLYLNSIYRKECPKIVRDEIRVHIKNLAKILLLEKQKILKAKMALLGIRDYLIKRKGFKF
ncbi:MAG: glycosyltransferase family 2 protein [Ignavibacteriaceae bacterium]|nr:glycosyltransferase family 2 protein [Ignavibacteriaceae bacterium]